MSSAPPSRRTRRPRAADHPRRCRRAPKPNQRLGHRLHHRRRAADEYLGRRRGLEADLGQHWRVDAPGVAAPAWWRLRARKGVNDLGSVRRRPKALQLLAVDDVRDGARGKEEACRHGVARLTARGSVPQHGHQRRDARAARDEQQRSARGYRPGEVAADWPAQLEPVARPGLVDEPGRHLPALQPLDREGKLRHLGRGGDRVAPLRLVAVVRCEADVDVLPREMAGPAWNIQHERSRSGRLGYPLDHLYLPPGEARRAGPCGRARRLNRRHNAAHARGLRRCGSRGTPRSPARRAP